MKVRPAALFLVLAVAGATFAPGLLSPRSGRSFAQEPGAGAAPPPEPTPTPGPSPTPTPPPPIPPRPAPSPTPPIPPGPTPSPTPTPTPAPAPGRTGVKGTSASGSISASGTASIDQAFPLEYRSIIDRLRYDPNNPALLNEQGNYLVQHGRLQQAIAQYQKAVKIQPDLAIAWNNLGVAYTAAGKFADGEGAYRRAIKVNPAYALAYYNLGASYDRRGNYDDAINYYQRAIEIDPTLLDVRVNPQIVSNRHIPAILAKSYLDRGGSAVLPVQSMYPPKTRKPSKP
jgi:Tfp pilus assembly protein PilF